VATSWFRTLSGPHPKVKALEGYLLGLDPGQPGADGNQVFHQLRQVA
jgi:hypothetical protein